MRVYAAIVALLLLPALAFGQAQTTGKVTGTILDENGQPVADARITFISPALQGERVVRTSENGQFLAALLPVGPYAVEIAAPGKQPMSVSFRLGVGETVPLDVTLTIGEQVVEEVTVYGAPTPLETTTLGENFEYDEVVEELPVTDRTLEGVATYAPNISFGPTPGTLSIAGAPSYDTTVLLDGAEVSDPYFGDAPILYTEDAIEEIQVLTAGVSARYGRFQGGVLNAITKSGGNTFDGTVRAEFDNDDWNSKTPFGEEQTDELNKVFQGSLGGYILKDRLWFFATARTEEDDESGTLVFGDPPASFTETEEDDRWQLKLKGAFTPDHVVEVSHLDFEETFSNLDFFDNCGDLRCVDGGLREDPRETNTLTYQGVLTPNLFLDFQATEKNVSIKGGGPLELGSPFWDFINDEQFGNAWFDFADEDVRDNETLGVNLTQAVNTSEWGSHTLEYGAQYVKSTTGGENRQAPTGLNLIDVSGVFARDLATGEDLIGPDDLPRFNLFGGAAFRFAALPFPGSPEATVESTALYFHDSWQLTPKWRFDIGARYDVWDSEGPLPVQTLDFNDLSPRLGVTYNIDRNWQVQAWYGKYVARVNDSQVNESTGVGAAPRTFDLYIGPDIVGGDYAAIESALQDPLNWFTLDVTSPDPPTTFLDPDLDGPYASDYNFSVKRALPRNSGSVTFTYMNREFRGLLDDFQGGFGIVDTGFVDPFSGEPVLVDATIWANAGQADRSYEAFTAILDYRPSAVWNVGGNWTVSETLGNYVGEGRNQPAIGTEIGTYVDSRAEEAGVPFGPLPGDVRHRVNVWGNYRFNFEKAGTLTLGSILQYRSGFPYNLATQVPYVDSPDYLGDAGNTYAHFFEGRGRRRFNGLWNLDVSVRYQFPIFRELNGWVKASVENVLNNDELISFSTAGSWLDVGGIPTTPGGPDDDNGDGFVDHSGITTFDPLGNCGLSDRPSVDCTGFGSIRNQDDYQDPRSYLLTFGLTF